METEVMRFFRKNGNLADEINGFIFFDHKYVSILKFVDHPVVPTAYDPEIIKGIIFLMDDGPWRKFPDGVSGSSVLPACV